MSYCINPNCSNRQNPDNLECCQTCGTKLLINDRYQIVKPLRAGLAYNNEVFEVKDLNERGTLKVLKSLAAKHNNSKHAELFEKEAQVLIWFSSAWQNHPGLPKVKPDGCFEVGICNGFRKLKCLVMEKIEGQNLEEWIEENQPISQAESLNWLKQLVEILDKVHRQGLWHRDIKPSNIMLKPDGQLVLIDFGAVGVGETKIISANYTPKEQIEGQTVPQSDFFALGRTFVYLLTGRHPSTLPEERKTGRLIWRCLAPRISTSLAQLIDDLMAPMPINRPQNTQEILHRLQTLDNPDKSRKTTPNIIALTSFDTSCNVTQIPTDSLKQKREFLVKWLGVFSAALLLGLAGTIGYNAVPCQFLEKYKTCGDKLSLGEKILSPRFLSREKEKAVKAFKGGEYTKAVNLLQEVRNNQKSDPESLIYLNNARIEVSKARPYTIAVAVPLDTSSEGLNSGLEILRGVAQAQNEFNQSQKRLGIKVLIADDANTRTQAKQIARAIIARNDVVAVVGHFTSDLTLSAANIYQQNHLVFVSPTSTSEDLSNQGKSHSPNFFFRTVPSDRITAQALANYLKPKNRPWGAAIFYNPASRYSDSLRHQFRDSLRQNGGTVVNELDLSELPSLERAMAQAGKLDTKGTKVLALFPDSQNIIIDNATNLIDANQCRYSMVGGDTLYSPAILKVGRVAAKANCLIIAVPWHSRGSPNPEFPQRAKDLWGGQVSWRTALAYDATRVLIEAVTRSQRKGKTVQQVLTEPNFQAVGATGVIRFQTNGDRKEANIQLVTIALDQQGKPMFVPLAQAPSR